VRRPPARPPAGARPPADRPPTAPRRFPTHAGAYSLFYFIGTLGAVQVPVVNTTPLRSLEQMGPLLVFVGVQPRNSFGAILGAQFSAQFRAIL